MPSMGQRMMLLPTALLAFTLSHVMAARITPRASDSNSIPAPVTIPPSQQWDGIDGSWSSFGVRIGTPAQDVRLFVSWNSYQTWAVIPEGCDSAGDYDACAEARGGIFNQSASTTWEQQGLYSLGILEDLGYYGNGYYGSDVVGLAENGPKLQDTTVAGFALEDFYLGVLGVNPTPTNYSSTDTADSYMSLLKQQSIIPSISFGFTAGARYRANSASDAFGSLTLGGYDDDKFITNDLTWKFGLSNIGDIVVALQSVNTPSSTKSSPVATEMLPKPIYINLDATVPQFWLPIESCYVFEYEFGLTYDNTTNLYLLNNTLHQQLLSRNASIAFQLALGTDDGENISVELPYAAFDLTASPPYQGVNNDTYYFPLRRAVNESQYTLGRVFFQEAYIAVDYESRTFNVSQRLWKDSSEQHIVTIPPFSQRSDSYPGVSPPSDNSSKGLSAGAIAGIVVGVVALLAIVGILLLWFLRRRSQARKRALDSENEKLGPASDAGSDADGSGDAVVRSGNESIVIPKAELPGSEPPMSTTDSDDQNLLAAGGLSTGLSTHGSSSPSDTRSPRTPNALSGATFVNGRWNGDSYSPIGNSSEGDREEGTGTYSSTDSSNNTGMHSTSGYGTGTGTHMSGLVSPLSPADSHEADGKEKHVFEMAGDMPTVKEKDGKLLSEKEAIAHREKVYNGVDTPPSPLETRAPYPPSGGNMAHASTSREPQAKRQVRPEDVVRASTVTQGGGGLSVPQQGRMHRAFSFEDRRDESHEELYE